MPLARPLFKSWFVQMLALAAAYGGVGWLAVQLAVPPSYASPLYPGAGLALAALLTLGLRLAPAIALGSFAVNVLLAGDRGLLALLAPALIGLGTMLQALAGAWLIRRWVDQPLLLSEPRDLLRFYALGAGLAGLISPSTGSLALLATGAVDGAHLLSTWATWWLGDTLGVLIGAPLVLCLLAQPREVWAPRRLSVALPLLITTLLMAYAALRVNEWDQEQERARFEREALAAASALEGVLHEPLNALEAMRSLLLVKPDISRQDFERASANYLRPDSPLLALGWAPLVARADRAALDAAARAEGLEGFSARDRGRPGDVQPPADEPMLVIRLIEPVQRNAPALGVNIRSIPASRPALQRAARNGRPNATAGFQLSQDAEPSVGVVAYQAIYAGTPATVEERAEALRGIAFATLRPDLVLRLVTQNTPDYLKLCLIDTDPVSPHRVLAGPADCLAPPAGCAMRQRALSFAGRDWDIRVYALPGSLPGDSRSSRAFALAGLAATALLGALLLTITGRASRIAALVQQRTAALQQEVLAREAASKALAESEQRFRNIFDNVPIGIVFADLDGMPQEINPQFCRMLGYSAEQLQGIRSLSFTHPDDRAEDLRLARMLIAGKIGMYRRNKRYLSQDGRVIHGRALVSLLRDAQGQPFRLVGVVEDITDQLKMQELERAREAAEAASQAKNEFLSRMSHELRTPLNAMLGFTQLLEMDREPGLSPRQRSWTTQVQQAGWHLLEMINDTLDLSRIESGALKLEPQRLDLDQLLDEAGSMVSKAAAQRGLRIERQLAADARRALGDPTRVRQVLTNLLSNAVKYNVEGGSIQISSQCLADGRIELAVADTGLGLSEAQLAQLFQPFNRLGRERSGTEGTGIGLVISKRLAELMGGELLAQRRSGPGACFVLRLPGAGDAGDAAASEPMPLEPLSVQASRHIVYIEDNAANVEVMRGILAQRQGWELTVYTDGASGLAAVLERPPHLLLLDMQLPDTDGLSVLQLLRAAPQCARLPVVAVSANALPEQIRLSQAAGVSHYLTKPVDVRQLLTLLDKLLAGG